MQKTSKIYIAGHRGLVGSAIKRQLEKEGYRNIVFRTSEELDLRDSNKVDEFFKNESPEYVFIAAAKVGGIKANLERKGEFIFDNLMIQTNMIHSARKHKSKKLVFIASNCIYPKESKQPIKEEYLFTGYLEPTNDAFAVAKLAGVKMCQAYNEQYNTKFISVVSANVFGPGDNFNQEEGHLVASLIEKFHNAKVNNQKEVILWGTGKPRREMLFVDDFARACIFLMNNYDSSEIINIGTGVDYEVKEIAKIIKDITGFEGEIIFDEKKPDGMFRKLLDVERINSIGWQAEEDSLEALKKTYQWFLNSFGNNIQKNNLKVQLMKNTFYNEDETKKNLANFILNSSKLSMDKYCKEFEDSFSNYQNRKFSVLYNSGSSANLALIQSLLNLKKINVGDSVGFSCLTWATNVMPLLQLGLKPAPIDVSLDNLNVDSNNLLLILENMPIKVLFITNLLGFCADLNKIKEICEKKGIILIEDNCESLGSELNGIKLGNFGLASSFSFYVGHHLSTIEGGMVCTDDEILYEMLLMVRAHGWSRNLKKEKKEELRKNNGIEEFYNDYTFYTLGFNLRPTEITGFSGLKQLEIIDEIHKKRNNNFKRYQEAIKKNSDIIPINVNHMSFVSNFAYPLVFKEKNVFEKYKLKFLKNVEIRPIVGGAIINQPFFQQFMKENDMIYRNLNAKKIHDLGFYIPNNPDLNEKEIELILDLLRKDF